MTPIHVARAVCGRIAGWVYQVRHGQEDMRALYGPDPNGLRSAGGPPPVGVAMISGAGGGGTGASG